jgi:membrane protein YqaA with SNARE-associated domain
MLVWRFRTVRSHSTRVKTLFEECLREVLCAVGSAYGIRVNSLAMDTLRTLFEQYGLLLVFGAVLVEQIGPPLPSGPLLIVAGALATEGRLSAWPVAAMAWGAGMLGKVALYVVGGRYGRQVMQSLCQMAVTPDSSIDKTDGHFERWGAPLLVVAEFIPGVRTLAPSLAEPRMSARYRFYCIAHSARPCGQRSTWASDWFFTSKSIGRWPSLGKLAKSRR